MKLTPKLLLQAAAGTLLAAAAAAGQQPPAARRPGAQPPERDTREVYVREGEQALHSVGAMARKNPRGRGAVRPDPAQAAEDFRLLQVVAHDLARAGSGAGALDLKMVAKSASEIGKRAARLGSALALPVPEKEDGRPKPAAIADDEGLRRSLAALHELIYRFVRNPVLTQANVVDAEQSAKARRDLNEIIELSGRVKKGSEGLEKGGKQ